MTQPALSWQARLVGGSLVPFSRGDTAGKRSEATKDALEQMERHQGVRRNLFELQAAMGESDLPEAECPLQHSFIDGVYVRTIFIPAGTMLVGKIHKHSHANILSQGEVLVITEDGGREHLKGPLTMVSPAGCKRAVKALTDTTWTTIHRTDETDLEKIEDWVIAKTYEDFEQFRLQGEAMKQIEVKP